MKSSQKGSTPTRTRCHRRKTVSIAIAIIAVFYLYNYITLMSEITLSSETVDERITFGHPSEKSTSTWKKMMRNETSRLGIHVLRQGAPINNIIVLGERHSGTTFFTKYVSDCFPSTKVGDIFVNKKHWIQYDPDHLKSAVLEDSPYVPPFWKSIFNHLYESNDPDRQYTNDYFRNSLVLVLFRDPYDWVEAMRLKPWHWPNHVSLFPLSAKSEPLNIKEQNQKQDQGAKSGYSIEKSFVGHRLLDWNEFVHRPLYLKDDEPANVENSMLCQMGYAPNTISPCVPNTNFVPAPLASIPKSFLRHLVFDTNNPIYEHNPVDQKPFENLLQLRAFKLRNLLSLPEQWEMAGVGYIPYENLLGRGLEALTNDISSAMGIPSSCPALEPFEKASYNLTKEFRDWITEAVEWDVESLIGYQKATS